MWYSVGMPRHLEISSLVGKPIVLYKDNKRIEVGTITAASVEFGEIEGIYIKGTVTDETLKSLLRDAAPRYSIGG